MQGWQECEACPSKEPGLLPAAACAAGGWAQPKTLEGSRFTLRLRSHELNFSISRMDRKRLVIPYGVKIPLISGALCVYILSAACSSTLRGCRPA